MRTICSLILIIISLFLLLSCVTESTPTYVLTTSMNGEGTVTPTGGEFDEGEVVKLNAVPSEGWQFVRWEGDYGGIENEISIQMNHDKLIKAIFEIKEYPLEINVEGEGQVLTEVIQSKHTDYEHGTFLRLTAEAEYGWEFNKWIGSFSNSQNPFEFYIDSPQVVTAVFKLKSYEIFLDVDQGGVVTLNPDKYFYQHGEEVKIYATPSNGYRFDGWDGNIDIRSNPDQFTIENNVSLAAQFSELTYLETGKTYVATDGMEVTVNSFETIEKIGSYQYVIDYTLHNPTDERLDENPFHIFNRENQNDLWQFGSFDRLFPGDTKNRSHTYEALKDEEFHYIGYVVFIMVTESRREREVTLTWEIKY